jgi:hypothetical protein
MRSYQEKEQGTVNNFSLYLENGRKHKIATADDSCRRYIISAIFKNITALFGKQKKHHCDERCFSKAFG